MGLLSGGNASSASNSVGQTKDNRVVADAQGQGATDGGATAKDYGTAVPINLNIGSGYKGGGNSTVVNVRTTDFGAIASAYEFADKAQDGANATVKEVLGVAEGNFNKTTAALQDAYKDAKGGALVLQNVTIGMIAAVVALGYFYSKGRKSA